MPGDCCRGDCENFQCTACFRPAVGLPEGLYQVSAWDGETLVSQRTVRMKNGYMTIVRTWPVAPR